MAVTLGRTGGSLPTAAGPCRAGPWSRPRVSTTSGSPRRPHRPGSGSRTPRGPRTSPGRSPGAPSPPPAASRRPGAPRPSASRPGCATRSSGPGCPGSTTSRSGCHHAASTGKRKTRPVRVPVTASATRPPSAAPAGVRARREDRIRENDTVVPGRAVERVEERPADHAEGRAGHEPGDRPGRHDQPPRPARRDGGGAEEDDRHRDGPPCGAAGDPPPGVTDPVPQGRGLCGAEQGAHDATEGGGTQEHERGAAAGHRPRRRPARRAATRRPSRGRPPGPSRGAQCRRPSGRGPCREPGPGASPAQSPRPGRRGR